MFIHTRQVHVKNYIKEIFFKNKFLKIKNQNNDLWGKKVFILE